MENSALEWSAVYYAAHVFHSGTVTVSRRSLGPKLHCGPKPETPMGWACAKGRHYACTKADCPCVRHIDDEQKTCREPGSA